jgi:hypothetical protein
VVDSAAARSVTTNYIVDELLTLLRARGASALAYDIGQQLFQGTIATVHQLTESEQLEAWDVFRKFRDKQWSFTDCTSKVVMERIGITTAITFDAGFYQFGTVTVVP